VQFAAHDGMVTREQLIDHVRTLAAWEVGLEPDSLRESASPRREVAFLAPATDIALRQLVSRYCDAVVRNDTDDFTALWSADSVWDLGTPAVGREAVATLFQKVMKSFTWLVQSAPNAVFEVDEAAGVGTGRVTITEQFKRARGGPGTLVGVYHDRYVRQAGGWLFAERRLEIIDQTK
jgi:ketosteroid isomerase-like protein